MTFPLLSEQGGDLSKPASTTAPPHNSQTTSNSEFCNLIPSFPTNNHSIQVLFPSTINLSSSSA